MLKTGLGIIFSVICYIVYMNRYTEKKATSSQLRGLFSFYF